MPRKSSSSTAIVLASVYGLRRANATALSLFANCKTSSPNDHRPYRLNRNPMLTGTLIYLAGYIIWFWSWQALLVWAVFFIIMFVQVLTEEKCLSKDFGEEYEQYCKRTKRF